MRKSIRSTVKSQFMTAAFFCCTAPVLAAGIISDKNISRALLYGGGALSHGSEILFQTVEPMENPDGCDRSDYYLLKESGQGNGVFAEQDYWKRTYSPPITIENMISIKVNNLPVTFKVGRCVGGFPLVTWLEF